MPFVALFRVGIGERMARLSLPQNTPDGVVGIERGTSVGRVDQVRFDCPKTHQMALLELRGGPV